MSVLGGPWECPGRGRGSMSWAGPWEHPGRGPGSVLGGRMDSVEADVCFWAAWPGHSHGSLRPSVVTPQGCRPPALPTRAAFTARAQVAVGSAGTPWRPCRQQRPRCPPAVRLYSCSIHTPISVLLLFEVCGKSSLMSPLQRLAPSRPVTVTG